MEASAFDGGRRAVSCPSVEPSPSSPASSLFDRYLDQLLRGEAPPLERFHEQHPELDGADREKLAKLASVLAPAPREPRASASPLPFERLGGYRLLRELGRGGMGVVYLAVQEGLGREVALKVVRPESTFSAEAKARFEREARAVAKLAHEGIVTVFEAGSDQGVSFLAMELLPGQGLDERLADLRARGERMPVEEALEIARQIALALEAAHRAGVVHRDVKPSNVRITPAGKTKLLDFGLALDPDSASISRTGQFHGTLHYVSPEQIRGRKDEVDGRSDVWSLGVTLYECLTGRVPFPGGTTQAVLHWILHEEPIAPRRLEPALAGDVETVVLKALEKERERRYESAAAFAADLAAILELRPIQARPTGPITRAWKWSRRKPGHAAAAALAAVLLVGGPSVYAVLQGKHAAALAVQSDRADEQRRIAELRLEELEQVAGFQSAMLEGIDVEAMGRGLLEDLRAEVREAAREQGRSDEAVEADLLAVDRVLREVNPTNLARLVVDRNLLWPSALAIETRFQAQPMVRATLYRTLCLVYREMALHGRARTCAERWLDIVHEHRGSHDHSTVEALQNLAVVLADDGRVVEGEAYAEAALELDATSPLERELRPSVLSVLARSRLYAGDYRGAVDACDRALAETRSTFGSEDVRTSVALHALAYACRAVGDSARAEVLLREAISIAECAVSDDDARLLASRLLLADLLGARGETKEALGLAEAVLTRRRSSLGDTHPDTLAAAATVASILRHTRDWEREREVREWILETTRAVHGEDHVETWKAVDNLAGPVMRLGQLAEAEAMLRAASEALQRWFDHDHPDVLISLDNLAAAVGMQQRYDEAQEILRVVAERAQGRLGARHSLTVKARVIRGSLLGELGRFDEGERELLAAVEAVAATKGVTSNSYRVLLADHVVPLYEAWDRARGDSEARASRWRDELTRASGAPSPAGSTPSPR